ncbi:unnamed protein product [Caenorhabditis bovis]|uniref:Major facilitator superfamily (MFS) profile domain-containing protein n=1 Tax=Caenorhabditis bovis TaxID=2654633 RepID=A0A8S1EIU0_9PELO|nr:unnamed protein product [Caenorhabditis bovis]
MAIERGAQKPIRRPPGRPRRMVFIEEEHRKSEYRYWWMVVFGFYILLSETGVRQVMNGFVTPIMESLNSTKSETDAALITIPISTSLVSGPFSSAVYQRVGARISILIGAMLCFIGYIAGTFCRQIYTMMALAIPIGIGCGLMRCSIISVQCEYFKKKRNAVMSFISIGPGIGIFVLPRIQKWIMDMEDGAWEPAWYFLAGLYVISGIMALFITRKPSSQTGGCSLPETKVLKKVEFDLHLVASFLAAGVNFIYISNILILMEKENIEDKETVYGYQGIATIIGKFVMTFVMSTDKFKIGYVIIVSYLIAQPSLFSGVFCYSLWQFRLQNFFSGIGLGLYQAASVPFIVAMVGPSQLAYALGYTSFVNGLAIVIMWWISNKFVEIGNSEDSRNVFYISIYMGCAAIVVGVVTSFVLMSKEKHKRKPSMKQMRHSSELNALSNINSVENC